MAVVEEKFGGTGQSEYTTGDILYADGTTSLAKLADVATGNAILSGGVGVAPAYGKVTSAHVDSTVAVLDGRSGGQILISGTDSADDLTLQSTSHATKGKILLGASGNSAYDEVNDRLGVGTNSPSALIHGLSTTEQLRLGYDATYYRSTTIASNGTGIESAIIQGGTGGTYQNAFEFSATNTVTATSSFLRTLYIATPTQTSATYPASAYGLEIADQGDGSTTGTGLLIQDQTVNGFGTAYGLVNYGNSLFAKQITSSLAIGTSPFNVTSTTVNTNLNADLLDGNHASAFALSSHAHSAADITSGTLAVARGGTGATSFTSGIVPYYNGSVLADSPVSVSGSDCTFAGEVRVPDGSSGNPSLTFSAAGGAGFWRTGSTAVGTEMIGFGDGAEATPSIHFYGDANTGLYRSNGDEIGIVTGGTTAITIDSSQNATFAGQIKGTNLILDSNSIEEHLGPSDSTAVAINYQGYLGGGTKFRDFNVYNGKATSIFFVDGSSGNVGIGTTSPYSLFTVDQSANASSTSDHSKGYALYNQGTVNASLTSDASYVYLQSWSSKPLQINNLGNDVILNATSGNVGIGTTSPDGDLHIHTASAGSVTASTYANTLVVESNTHSGMSFLCPAGYNQAIYFGDADDNDVGFIQYLHGNDALNFGVAGTGVMRLNSTGLGIGTTAPNYKSTVSDSTGNYFASALLSAAIGTPGNWVGQLYGYSGSTYQKCATIFESSDSYGRGTFNVCLNSTASSVNTSLADSLFSIDYLGRALIGRTTYSLGGGNGDDLQIGSGSGSSGMTIHSSTSGSADIQFADGTVGNASYRGLIRYSHTADSLEFWTAASQALLVDSSGNVGIGTTPTAFCDVAASTTSVASLRLRSGTAPTSPNAGDVWFDGTNFKGYNGSTTATLG